MSVSNEDREPMSAEDHAAATVAVTKAIERCGCPICVIDALVALGWGPRPTVSRKEIDGWVLQAANHPLTVANGIADYLRECGIEVAE